MNKKLRFIDGTELDVIGCFGAKEYFRNILRDTLEIRINPSIMTMDNADSLFNAENCAALVIVDGEEQFVHEGYVERISLTKAEKSLLTDGGETITATMICVKMGKQTEAEIKLSELEIANNILLGLGD